MLLWVKVLPSLTLQDVLWSSGWWTTVDKNGIIFSDCGHQSLCCGFQPHLLRGRWGSWTWDPPVPMCKKRLFPFPCPMDLCLGSSTGCGCSSLVPNNTERKNHSARCTLRASGAAICRMERLQYVWSQCHKEAVWGVRMPSGPSGGCVFNREGLAVRTQHAKAVAMCEWR